MLHRVEGALPRAYVPERHRSVRWGAIEASELDDEDVVSGRSALVQAGHLTLLEGPPARGTALVTTTAANTLAVHASMERGGILVVTETWAPGWTARVDGEESPVHRINGYFRGVEVGAGEHDVVFAYEPPGLRLGIAVSLAALAITTVLAIRVRKRA